MKQMQIIRLVCFVLLVLLSAAYPVSRILKYENPSVPAETFLFKVQGYDPADLFRGHYLRLRVLPDELPVSDDSQTFSYNTRKCYLEITADPAGYASAVSLSAEPSSGKTFVQVIHPWKDNKTKMWHFKLPFDRYFVNADRAPELEKKIRTPEAVCALKVRIYQDGSYVVDDLLINGESTASHLEKEKQQ